MTYYNQSKILTEFKAKLDSDLNHTYLREHKNRISQFTLQHTLKPGECETWCFPRFLIWDKEKDHLLLSLSSQSKPVLPVNDTSIIIYHPESGHFQIILMVSLPNWTCGLKQINFSYTLQNTFVINIKSSTNLNTCYDLKIIEVVTILLGLQIDDNLNQLSHNTYNIPKLKCALWWEQSRQQML